MSKREDFVDKLISAVQSRECLWDPTYRGHRNRFKLERYWNEVAAELELTSLTCRKRWKNLKDQYRKEIKKNPDDSDWPHFSKLEFLKSQFVVDECVSQEGQPNLEQYGFEENPKLSYTIRKKFLVNRRRNIEVDLNKLIELVKEREIVWNRQLRGHHNWYKLDACWKEIAEQLGVTRDEARMKWKHVRDTARNESRKADSEWALLGKVQFLVNQFYDPDGNKSNQDYEQHYFMPEPEDMEINVPIANEDNDETITDETNKDDDFDEFDTKPVIIETDFYEENETEINPLAQENTDEDASFFTSLLPHVKKLPPHKKLMLRMKIQELVYNTVYT